MTVKKVLVALTSVSKYPDMNVATGLWFGEAVHFVHELTEAGIEVDFVSPQGGYTPIDPNSFSTADATEWKYYQNREFLNRLGNTLTPTQVVAEDYVAIYFAGGHGTVFDFLDNAELQNISTKIYEREGYVCAVCHGSLALVNIKKSDGTFLIDSKKVTGFSNEEEKAVKMDEHVPVLTETELRNRGGIYLKSEKMWEAFAVEDERIISGQNPASAAAVAKLLLKCIK